MSLLLAIVRVALGNGPALGQNQILAGLARSARVDKITLVGFWIVDVAWWTTEEEKFRLTNPGHEHSL